MLPLVSFFLLVRFCFRFENDNQALTLTGAEHLPVTSALTALKLAARESFSILFRLVKSGKDHCRRLSSSTLFFDLFFFGRCRPPFRIKCSTSSSSATRSA